MLELSWLKDAQEGHALWNPVEEPTLARLVLPETAAVQDVLDAVRERSRTALGHMGPERLLQAVYEELTARRILYDFEPLSLGCPQRVRLPDEILRSKTATCLELVLLLAACAEAAHKQPLLLQLARGDGSAHALLGVWLRLPVQRRVLHDAAFAHAGREVLLVEGMGVTTNEPRAFAQARRAATRQLRSAQWTLRFALDVAHARQRGLMPLYSRGDFPVQNYTRGV